MLASCRGSRGNISGLSRVVRVLANHRYFWAPRFCSR
ncbi:hypothetical protein ACJ72_06532 [Emergomyces africanus]|uniref:Uncharacterized protein n=1 Tax=Emergomyces africanus TaxID=1955775 RepID=A0A1B7NR85_9EURO|nr:hypothetical protein ACJ72_06532 [Emergomyces africanus]